MFESLGYQSGFFLSQLFSSTRANPTSSSSAPMKQTPTRPPPPIFNWAHPPLPLTAQFPPPNFHHSPQIALKDNSHLFLMPHQSADHHHGQMEGMMHTSEHEPDLKWPNGLSFFTALTGRNDEAKILFEGLGNENKSQVHQQHHHHPLVMAGKNMHSSSQMNLCANSEEGNNGAESNTGNSTEDYLGLESHSNKVRKVDNSGKFKRSFTMPARMATSSSSTSLDQHHQQQQHHGTPPPQGMEYRSSEAGIYSDIMETFLE